ncbi:MAG: TetR/AcrR family transcriptional regulator [Ilumatobacteraceae bacterium]|nr:TetR/AcrR family transcriptional regulator [Ilumatobacteraceae bacterium]
MNAGRKVVEKRLGRPPATDSGDTKRRILDIAREMFSVHGYEVATNRDIASAAGITSGALYHYFGSKLDLYLAVHEDVQAGVYESFSNATMNLETFTEMFLAVLEVAHDMNENDPSVARFVGAVRVDAQRHPEMAAALLPRSTQREDFFTRLIDIGVKTGEIDEQQRSFALAFLLTVLVGLTDAVSGDNAQHKQAIEAIKMVMTGDLLRSPLPHA